MAPLKITHGPFRVMRYCCTSGNCFDCHAVFDMAKRKRVVQLDRLSKKSAEQVAANWRAYGATVERMPGG